MLPPAKSSRTPLFCQPHARHYKLADRETYQLSDLFLIVLHKHTGARVGEKAGGAWGLWAEAFFRLDFFASFCIKTKRRRTG